ncbi:MAG: putative holin-like toxin [Lacrimispora saccharolytica]
MLYCPHGKPQSRAAYPLIFRRGLPSRRKKGGLPMVTYSDLIQIGILIVALVGLVYEIIKDKRK